jgi:hypothetical protein
LKRRDRTVQGLKTALRFFKLALEFIETRDFRAEHKCSSLPKTHPAIYSGRHYYTSYVNFTKRE